MEEKIKLIDRIVQKHPSYGIGKGWSHYTGGMKDDGGWYFRKMLDVPYGELKSFLYEIIAEENKPPLVYTEQEKEDMKIIYQFPNGCWINGYVLKNIEKDRIDSDYNLFFGISL